jgi:signal transduction histidine kinase
MSSWDTNPAGDSTPGRNAGSIDVHAEEIIADLKKELELTRKKLQIVGSVTRHDVLNQLTAIIGFNELLRMMIQDPKMKNYVEKEKLAIDRIRLQFQYSKDYQNIAVDPPRWQNIRNLINIASDECVQRGVRVITDTGDAAVLADPLLDKGLQYLFEDGLCHGTVTEIRISLILQGVNGVLLMENNGAGIPEEEKSRIFDRGYAGNGSWGLFLTREIMAVTGLTITETGDPERGVRFEITLPPGMLQLNVGEPSTTHDALHR